MAERSMRVVIESIEGEYRRYKALAEGAFAQLADDQLTRVEADGANAVATLVWHLSGNLESRFTDFLESDGEKPWRDRESEFLARSVTRAEMLEKWRRGWRVLFDALGALDDGQLSTSVTIRGVALSVSAALHRSLAHTAYHVGQIVFLAKAWRGREWRSLSIPPGGSSAYNANPAHEKPPDSA